MPAAVGFAMPVPPPPAESVPVSIGVNVNVPPEFVMVCPSVKPLKEAEEVAKVMAPVCAEPPPLCVSERSPVLVTLPFAYARPEEKVVEAVQVGMPLRSASTWPAVPADVVASADEPLPKRSEPAAILLQPVPPWATSMVVPFQTPEEMVPNEVSKEETMLLASVVPVRVPAGAMTALVEAAVSLPC